MPVRADDATVFQCCAVKHLKSVAGWVGEPNHLVDATVGQLGGGCFLIGHTLKVECIADLLQAGGIRAFPAGLGQLVVLARNDHDARGELVHPEIQRSIGVTLALDHAENFQGVLPPCRDIGGLESQIAQ